MAKKKLKKLSWNPGDPKKKYLWFCKHCGGTHYWPIQYCRRCGGQNLVRRVTKSQLGYIYPKKPQDTGDKSKDSS